MRLGILLFDGVEELDFVGPFEAFSMVGAVSKAEAFDIMLVSKTGDIVSCSKGLQVKTTHALEDVAGLDILLVPGGRGTRAEINCTELIAWIDEISKTAKWVTSVCTGAFLLAKSGLTIDKRLTTHHMAFDEFKSLKLSGTLVQGERYIRDGNLVTAAGVSAGIDMALWLIGEIHSIDLAKRVQSAMEYYPEPPFENIS